MNWGCTTRRQSKRDDQTYESEHGRMGHITMLPLRIAIFPIAFDGKGTITLMQAENRSPGRHCVPLNLPKADRE